MSQLGATLTAAPDLAAPRVIGGGFFHRYRREISVALAYGVLLLVLAVLRPAFFRLEFAQNWVSAAPLLIAAVGMTLVILAREIDISIGSQFSICGVVAGLLAAAHAPLPVTVVCTVLAGAAMGAVNGLLVAMAGLPSIVVTLATMVVLRGALLWASQGAGIRLPPSFQWFGAAQASGQVLIVGVAVITFAVFAWAMRWMAMGRAVYAVGSDQEAARLTGIRPKRVLFVVFTLMGALTALAALLSSTRFAIIYPDDGRGLELQVIAAVVVGGTAISGGRGTMIGTLIGVALLATIRPALAFLTPNPYWDKAVQGAIILMAVASDGLYRKGR